MRKLTIGRIIFDRARLVLCALAVFGGMMAVGLFARSYLALEEDWIRFVFASLAFPLLFFYIAVTTPVLRTYRKDVLFVPLLLGTGLFPALLAFTLFFFKFLPMPNHVFPYLVASLVLLPALIMCLRYFLAMLRRR